METLALPEYVIDGTTFLVDVKSRELVEKGVPDNSISFLLDMHYRDDHYQLHYDTARRTSVSVDMAGEPGIIEVQIPHLAKLDPKGLAAEYNVAVKGIEGKTDFDVMVDQEIYQRRAAGQLPVIKLGDDNFFANVRLGVLEQENGMFNHINMHHMDVTADGEKFWFFYDAGKKQMYEPPTGLLAIPDKVFLATIPNELVLDPYSVARSNNIDIKGFLLRFPQSDQFKATMVPAKHTALKEFVEANRKEYKQQDQGQDRSTSNGKKHS